MNHIARNATIVRKTTMKKAAMNTSTFRTTLGVIAGVLLIAANTALAAEAAKAVAKTLITDARIFDGKSDKLTEPMSVLVEGNKINKIATSITAHEGATLIDAGGAH